MSAQAPTLDQVEASEKEASTFISRISERITLFTAIAVIIIALSGGVWTAAVKYSQTMATDQLQDAKIHTLEVAMVQLGKRVDHRSGVLMEGLQQLDLRVQGLPPDTVLSELRAKLKDDPK